MSFTKIYLAVGSLIVAFYLFSESRGMIYGSSDTKSPIPTAAKSGRGYRAHGFWFVGYRGGK